MATFIGTDADNNITYQVEPSATKTMLPNTGVAKFQDEIAQILETVTTYKGQPVVVTSAEDMTEETVIYLYMGEEEGYNADHWYYYDTENETWTDGGAYVANPVIIDDTLTQAGEAADAKVTGDELTQIKSDLSDVTDNTNLFSELTIHENKRLDAAGTLTSADGYFTSAFIPVFPGCYVTKNSPINDNYHRIAVYTSESNFAMISGQIFTDNLIQIPDSGRYVRICGLMTEVATASVKIISANDVIARNIASTCKRLPMGYMTVADDMSDDDEIQLPITNVKNQNCYIFNANITTFDSVKMGKEHYLVVDDTNITVTNDSGGAVIPHGLTIGNNITIIIENEESTYTSLIRVESDGNVFSYTTPVRFIMDNGYAYVRSLGSELTECRLSWVSKNVNAPIWIFGDSYLSWYPERWAYYAAEDNNLKNIMLNGYSGQNSLSALASLRNLLTVTTPKIVVWCMGMNDGDTSSAVNASWQSAYEQVINLHKIYGFELVLYTVPTTTVVNNRYKDSIVRASGYRYIEADLAVRIDAEGHWITGTIESDNVHPTAQGAKILYYRILTDLPEMMCNY